MSYALWVESNQQTIEIVPKLYSCYNVGMNTINNIQDVIDYYHTWESRLGYVLLLKGTRHFGYYPEGKEKLSYQEAQEEMNKNLAKRINLPSNSKILDAGCGEGNTAISLAKSHGYQIEGIDLLDASIKKAQENIRQAGVSDKIHLTIGDYASYDWPKDSFDGIYTMEALVHLADYRGALSHFHQVLKPGGRLVLFEYSMTPPKDLKHSQTALWNQIIEHTSMFGLPHFHHGKFPEILNETGFADVHVEDITARVLPMLQSFHRIGKLPYVIVRLLGLETKFINAMFAVEGYDDIIKHGTWRYNIITARKK